MTYPLYVAIVFIAGMAGGKIASKLKLPSVTGYILFGLLLGPSLFNIITTEVYHNLGFINELATGMLGVTVGAELHRSVFKSFGKNLTIMSIGNTMFTLVIVTLTTWFLGLSFNMALILGALSLTVSPSGVIAIIKDTKAEGELTQNLLGLVAFDNLVSILVFGFVVSFVQSLGGASASAIILIGKVLLDLVLAASIGAATGFFVSFFIRKKASHDKLLVYLMTAILLNTGLASYFGLSPILTNIVTGLVITNLTSRKVLVATVMDRIDLPVFVLFLTLAGAHLDVAIIPQVGLLGLGYIVARSLGRYLGIVISSRATSVSKKVRYNLGFGLLPQAGIAIGLSAIAGKTFPEMASTLTSILLTGVIFFEIFGPLLLERAIKKVDEAHI